MNAVKSFISYVEKQPGQQNIGIIYYCGHGIASQAGSRYFVPGDINISVFDTTYESLSEKLININTIKHLVIDAQSDSGRSQYILMADSCSEQDFSKWYTSIRYHYDVDSSSKGLNGVIEYDSSAIRKMMGRNSMLKASTEINLESLKDTKKMIAYLSDKLKW